MSQKTYIAASRLTLPVVVDGKVVRYVNFYDEKNTFTTDDAGVQQALEALPAFGSLFAVFRGGPAPRTKSLSGGRPQPAAPAIRPVPPALSALSVPSDFSDKAEETEEADFEEMPEITDWQAAREVLKADPYKVPYQALVSPEAILKKAEENKVRFPNLTL